MSDYNMTAFAIPGYAPPDALPVGNNTQQHTAKPYKIPPVFWMFFFLIVGYGLTKMSIGEAGV